MTSSDPQWPQNINFSQNLTLGHAICLLIGFFRVDCTSQNQVWSHKMTSKWPQVTLLTSNITFLPQLTLGHAMCLFMGFGKLRWLLYQMWVTHIGLKTFLLQNLTLGHVMCLFIGFFWMLLKFEFRVTKWPPKDIQITSSDPYWPQTYFLTKSHFGACNAICLFIGFSGCWVDCAYQIRDRVTKWPPNDLKWPSLT